MSGKKRKNIIDDYALGSSEHFQWYAQAGRGSVVGVDWIERKGIAYLEQAYKLYEQKILKLGALKRLPIKIIISPSSECGGGISGATGSGELRYCAGHWASNQFCYGILAHELCNLLTGECITAGWPATWWANHRSPFPTVAANQILKHTFAEYYTRWGDYRDPLVIMFQTLFNQFPEVFPKMFQKMQQFKISLSILSEPYLSHVVYYFMFWGAQRNLESYFVNPPMPPLEYPILQRLENQFKLGVVDLLR